MLADLHLHFEGCVPARTLVALARRGDHPFGRPGAFRAAVEGVHDAASFLGLYRDACSLFRMPGDYGRAARAAGRALARDLAHAEVYVSPEIWRRFGLPAASVLDAIDRAFGEVERETGSRLVLLLDTVRHWGVEAAERVLDFYEAGRWPRVAGFGMGGDEAALPARAFRDVYERARRLGLATAVHAGEWAGPASVAEALDELPLDRIDHGVRACEDRSLLARLSRSGIPLCVAPTSNVRTRVCASWKEHPLPRLLEAGVRVCLSADDPTFFRTGTPLEYESAGRHFGFSSGDLTAIAAVAWASRRVNPRAEGAASPPPGK